MNQFIVDCRTALRFFGRRRAAFVVIIFTMALALGANTAVFSMLRAFVFSSLGVPESDRVMIVWTTKVIPGQGRVDFNDAYPNYQHLKAATHFWEKISCVQVADVNWEEAAETHRLQAARVTTDFFAVMRVPTVLGRVFTEQEQGPNAAPVAVISHAFWMSRFAGSREVLGKTLRLNGVSHTIVGVLAPVFSQPQGSDIWLPFDLPADRWTKRLGAHVLYIYARLAPGMSAAAADRELLAFAPRALEASAESKDWGWRVQPLRKALLSGADDMLVLVQAGAAVLLMLTVSNLASLLIAWSAERQRESAVRLALGAAWWQLTRQFLVQSVMLVAISGGAGVLLAGSALPLIQKLNPDPALASFLASVKLDRDTLGFSAMLVLGIGLITGLLPAWQARKIALVEALRSESRGASLSRDALRWQQAMIVLQAAISVLILTVATFAGLGFWNHTHVQPGFAPDHRVVFRMQFPEPAYDTNDKRAKFVRDLEQNIAKEPSLLGFGITSTLPVGDLFYASPYFPQLPGGEYPEEPIFFNFRKVSPSYLPAMGIPLIEGRLIDERDRPESPPVAVVSKALADKYWPGRSALGRRLKRLSPAGAPPIEVVGVVGSVMDQGLGPTSNETIYEPFAQISRVRCSVVLHGRGSTAETLAAGLHALRATEPGVAPYNIVTVEELVWQASAVQRLQILLLGLFGSIAVGITAIGSYGIMSQLVASRRKEMAIRAALGATSRSVLLLVLRGNAQLAASGTAIGLFAAWLSARWIQASSPDFDASPLWPYALVALGIMALTQLASFIPAYRAARTEGTLALQNM